MVFQVGDCLVFIAFKRAWMLSRVFAAENFEVILFGFLRRKPVGAESKINQTVEVEYGGR